MNQPYTLYRHRCDQCGAEFISEFQGSFSAARYDHLDQCPSALQVRQEWVNRHLTVDQARVDASDDAAQAAIAEWADLLKTDR